MNNRTNEAWLCRNCNTLVSNDLNCCPRCNADHPAESCNYPIPEEISNIVEKGEYANDTPAVKSKYNFREGVLVNAADIVLVLGLFCTFGALLSPMFIDGVENIGLISVCVAVALFAFSMVQWALLRSVADISRHLRERDERTE